MEKELTEDNYHQLDDIPNEEVISDIEITERELKDLQDELKVLYRNPSNNRMLIYTTEGRIMKREQFIQKLNNLLSLRKNEHPRHF